MSGIAGDTDLYLSTTNVRPRLDSSTWLSASIGGDEITLTTDHPDWDPLSPALYIGV